ncbi:MAG: AAA family ATPase [Chloroflexi bacterium]|nr:AAA family ATPase [Chloroflexota bacterium]
MPDQELTPSEFGRTYKAFMDAMLAAAVPRHNPLQDRLAAHLGVDVAQLPVLTEELDDFEHPNLQVALDACAADPGRRVELIGLGLDNRRFMALGLSDLLTGRTPLGEGPVDYVNFRLADDQPLACVQLGLYFVSEGDARLVVLVAGPVFGGPRPRLRVEVAATSPDSARRFLEQLRQEMLRRNVYRGHVISLAPGQIGMGPQSLVAFHTLPAVDRPDLVLPDGVLDRIERHTVGFTSHVEQLRTARRSLKRGLLLHGPPGVGKTLTVMYLAGRMPGRTVLLTTGAGMGLLRPVAQLARTLAPSLVVLEDVDLIAMDRNQMGGRSGPLLFEWLNEMDGLTDDRDVIFLLTTNRPEILEPALAARPGRIDLVVELPYPDAVGRRRLVELYGRGLDLSGVDTTRLVQRTDGASPAYLKELLRHAAVLAVAGDDSVGLHDEHVEQAIDEMAAGGELGLRIMGFQPSPGGAVGQRAGGYPTSVPRSEPGG